MSNVMLTEAELKKLSEEIEQSLIEMKENMKKPEMQNRLEKLKRLKSELENK